jgi:hypothetical protein
MNVVRVGVEKVREMGKILDEALERDRTSRVVEVR